MTRSCAFKLPAEHLMEVTHHQSPEQFQCYVVNSAWRDRIMTRDPILRPRRTQRERSPSGPPDTTQRATQKQTKTKRSRCKPPVTNSVPDALGRMNDTHENAFGSLKQTQTNINSTTQLILKELKNIRAREEVG